MTSASTEHVQRASARSAVARFDERVRNRRNRAEILAASARAAARARSADPDEQQEYPDHPESGRVRRR